MVDLKLLARRVTKIQIFSLFLFKIFWKYSQRLSSAPIHLKFWVQCVGDFKKFSVYSKTFWRISTISMNFRNFCIISEIHSTFWKSSEAWNGGFLQRVTREPFVIPPLVARWRKLPHKGFGGFLQHTTITSFRVRRKPSASD